MNPASLGYGCSQLMTRTGRAGSLRLLETALDAGITHFDVARSYGYGEAEGVVGEFLRGRRDRVTVATKLGLDPPRRSRALAAARAAARVATTAVPPLRRAVRAGAARMAEGGRFTVAEARASLETSLRELRTDHVDLLLLHDVEPAELSDELHRFLDDAVREGAVGRYGIATSADASAVIAAERPELARVVQVQNGVTSPASRRLPELWRGEVITHSPLHGLADVARRAGERDRAELAALMLAWARAENPGGIVLFSSRDPAHIRANARSTVDAAVVARAERLVAGVPPPRA